VPLATGFVSSFQKIGGVEISRRFFGNGWLLVFPFGGCGLQCAGLCEMLACLFSQVIPNVGQVEAGPGAGEPLRCSPCRATAGRTHSPLASTKLRPRDTKKIDWRTLRLRGRSPLLESHFFPCSPAATSTGGEESCPLGRRPCKTHFLVRRRGVPGESWFPQHGGFSLGNRRLQAGKPRRNVALVGTLKPAAALSRRTAAAPWVLGIAAVNRQFFRPNQTTTPGAVNGAFRMAVSDIKRGLAGSQAASLEGRHARQPPPRPRKA